MTRRWLLWLVPLILCFALSAMFLRSLGKDPTVRNDTMLGAKLPTVTLVDLASGKEENLPIISETPYVLNFWGSWCGSCRTEAPILTKLQLQGAELIGINYKDTPLEALKFLAEFGNPFRLNLQDSDGQLGLLVGVTGAPETFIVNPQGMIKAHIVGELTEDSAIAIQQCLTLLKTHSNADCNL